MCLQFSEWLMGQTPELYLVNLLKNRFLGTCSRLTHLQKETPDIHFNQLLRCIKILANERI